jgi:hypothetical protein
MLTVTVGLEARVLLIINLGSSSAIFAILMETSKFGKSSRLQFLLQAGHFVPFCKLFCLALPTGPGEEPSLITPNCLKFLNGKAQGSYDPCALPCLYS